MICIEDSRKLDVEEKSYSNYDTPEEIWAVTDLDGWTSSYDPDEQKRLNRINGQVRVLKRKYGGENN